MKTTFTSALIATFAGLFLLNSMSTYGQDSEFTPTNDNSTLTMAFYKTDTVLVVAPDACTLTETDKKDIENYVFWVKSENKPVYTYKSESEVTAKDCKKHILLYGSYNCFQRKEFLRIPIKKLTNGFQFRNRIFDQDTDAFFYINGRATRMYVCKNSGKTQHELFSIGVSGYPLHIFRGNDIVITGVYL